MSDEVAPLRVEDEKFLVTAMHEPALHGWRLADSRHMRMTGYPTRVKSMSWGSGGRFLATSGADMVIMWPFVGKDGPMGKEPAMLARLQATVPAVACHPEEDVLAAGYEDGTVDVFSGGRKMRVALHPEIEVGSVARGQEVVLNESLNVVMARGAEISGEVVTLKDRLEEGSRGSASIRAPVLAPKPALAAAACRVWVCRSLMYNLAC